MKKERKGFALVAFTDRGIRLAERLAEELGGVAERAGAELSLHEWTERAFLQNEALIFIGAAGIAVRAVAPFLRSKAEDPAVICIDEHGENVIPLLSGHLGGANALAEKLAEILGGRAVITTATDRNRVFAVDLWAKTQGLAVRFPAGIKEVSSRLLRGETVTIVSQWRIEGEIPTGIRRGEEGEVIVDYRDRRDGVLQLIPRMLHLGIGCRKGISCEQLEEAFACFCRERGILPESVAAAASIALKQNEEGLLRFCKAHGWKPRFFTAEELRQLEGDFTASAFVEHSTGVDNVCERAAVLSGGGKLAEKKYAENGVTFALAEQPVNWDWSW